MGYVYFLKHNKLPPVKIGMTSNDDINKRICHYNTSSPYGVELLGFIETKDFKKIESKIHSLLKDKRLNGEWFDIDRIQVKEIIEKFSYQKDERLWLKFDIPFNFNYKDYYINELK